MTQRTQHAHALVLSAIIISIGTLAASFPIALPVSTAISTAVLITAVIVAMRSGLPRAWLVAVLFMKALYAADIVLALHDGRPLRYAPEIDDDAARLRGQTLLMLCLWVASFITSAALFVNRATELSPASIALEKTGFVKAIALGLIVLSQIGFATIVHEVGGVARMLASMSNRHEVYFGIGFLRVLVGTGSIGCALLFLSGRKKLSWLITITIFFQLALLGGRSYALFSTILPITMLWISNSKKIPIGRIALIAVFALVFVSALGKYRSSQLSEQYHAATGVLTKLVMDTGAADNFPSLLSLLRRDAVPFSGAEIVASGLLAPIPRAVWAGKPITDEAATVGVILANADRVNWGLPIGPHGLAYFTGGTLLIPVFGFISGLFFASVLARSRKTIAWTASALFLLLLSPDILSPSTTARAFTLIALTATIALTLRLRLPR